MSIPVIKASRLSYAGPAAPVLVAGPSLGTSGTALWSATAAALPEFTVIAWDLPGHGTSPAATDGFTVAELADAVAALVQEARNAGDIGPGQGVCYAGVSLGGVVGLQLGLDHGKDFEGLAILCSGAKIGEPEGWLDRAATVRNQGTPAVLTGSAQRWFAPGFIEREKEAATALLHSLQDADRFSYAYCCEALAGFDVREQLGDITLPVLAAAGAADEVTPPSFAEFIANGTPNGTSAVVDGAAHLLPAEKPAETAELLRRFFGAAHQEGL
ncbi:alpha/beta fold hydrolase [Arthrobacter sp. zg-Y820]|uniref:alpha/beta fold hydrolase n=1 Tax=unclassified Arthrobacter TaxID=235627 RepID=UPI00254246A7|nr:MULTISPECIES: alpha/beta fold hydrolase [unclassified Arthrobacter]MCC9195783.1 alpha/beta hydrolase [Arthrobacter sp. zg-Y820]MDK1278642.1 alpha/beta fold hydrolase [Arthrobacter sp. zg.Y820]MDK1359760.1 alpha/beta fold hydrolase [Arthrobacter sp. zg-Y1219]WIB08927.1 alpha/beta fold hydrolase [Arthrobacter sp. zg-Y820]